MAVTPVNARLRVLRVPRVPRVHPVAPLSRTYSSDDKKTAELERLEKAGQLSLSQRFKLQFKRYWYVLVPVHVATSVVWFGGFYLMCKSGVDVSSILSTLGASETYVAKLKDSDLGYYAMAYACYKVATPVRYTVTLGGTTLTVRKLSEYGWLKTTSEVASDFRDRSDQVKHKMDDFKGSIGDMREKVEDEWERSWKRFAEKRKKP
eukprot:TCALIF_08200-PA protein Name:"Similar to FAM210A Protein FAM210A (Gallus gallus)" AED:0.06 eAED:0.06 QI:0/0/0/0.66/1/1/3/0/205